MLLMPKIKELSFLVYGLGLSGCSVDKYFKKKEINGFFLSRYYQLKIILLAFIPLYKVLKNNEWKSIDPVIKDPKEIYK